MMKKIIAILDNQAVDPLRAVLVRAGMTGITMIPVTDECEDDPDISMDPDPGPFSCRRISVSKSRKRSQRREKYSSSQEGSDEMPLPVAEFLPKTMMILVVMDEDADLVVRMLMSTHEKTANRSGKIFVCPLVSALGTTPDSSL